MKKQIVFFCIMLLFAVGILGQETQSNWVGIWRITYFSINEKVWKEKKIELNAVGAVNLWTDKDGFTEVGFWNIEKYPLKYSNLNLFVLYFNTGLEEFIIPHSEIKTKHYGVCAVAEMGYYWITNIYEFEMIKIGNL